MQGESAEDKAQKYGDDFGGQVKKGAADGKHWASKQVDNVKHQADRARGETNHKASEAKHKVEPKVDDAKSGVSGAIESVKDTVIFSPPQLLPLGHGCRQAWQRACHQA